MLNYNPKIPLIDEKEVRAFERLAQSLPGHKKMYYVSQDPHRVELGGVMCLPWYEFLNKIN